MNGYIYHLLYDFRTGVKDKSLMLMNYLFPLAFLLMTGLFMTPLNPFFKDIMIPGMVVFAAMTSALMALSGTIISDREAGIYRSFRVNGVPSSSLITIPILSGLVHALAAAALITAVSAFVFGGKVPVNWGWFVLVYLLAALSLSTLGILIGIVSPSQRAGLLLAQAIYIPSVLLSGMMVPLDLIPDNLSFFVSLLPASHAVRGFEALAMNATPAAQGALTPVIVLCVSIIMNLILCFMLFQWDAKLVKKRRMLLGLLAFLPFLFSSFL